MKVAYISGPYRDKSVYKISLNIFTARMVAARLWRKGYAVICPHTNTAFFDGVVDDDRFLAGDIELLKKSDVVVMMRGWLSSAGALAEYNLAVDLKKEILFETRDNEFVSHREYIELVKDKQE